MRNTIAKTMTLLLMAAMIFTGCSKDSGSSIDKAKLIGSWKSMQNWINDEPFDAEVTITLNANNTGIIETAYMNDSISIAYTWTLSGSTINIKVSSYESALEIENLTDNHVTIYGTTIPGIPYSSQIHSYRGTYSKILR